ncbi:MULTISPECIES: hypothetical protein [Brevibacillus]|uniref:hypothetical protein n=1 Tax=Brevibacillus TaxID=55080 RepID=UPI00156B5B80|nr:MULTISPECIES: hypothetical protein [Brevibacillus]MDR5002779.1 hypothetical protein [Brevibacillus parabrevis]UED70827.1 hypothetical protein HP435_09365 [Brevibacillus sp. HD3.3A]
MGLQKKIESLFQELKFERVIINGIPLLLYGGTYYKITFVKGLDSYVIEFASTYDEAVKNMFEDGDIYPVSLGEEELISELRHDLIKFYMNE